MGVENFLQKETNANESGIFLPSNSILSKDSKQVYEGPFLYDSFKSSHAYQGLLLSERESTLIENHVGNDKSKMVFLVQSDAAGGPTRYEAGNSNQRVFMGTIENGQPGDVASEQKIMKVYTTFEIDDNNQVTKLVHLNKPLEVELQKAPVGNSYYIPQDSLDKLRDEYNKSPERGSVIETEARRDVKEQDKPIVQVTHSSPETETLTTGGLSTPSIPAAALAGLKNVRQA